MGRKRRRRRREEQNVKEEEEDEDQSLRKRCKAEDSESCKEDEEDDEPKLDVEEKDDLDSQTKLSDYERKRLEALAWRGPDPDARTREDDFEDYFNELFL